MITKKYFTYFVFLIATVLGSNSLETQKLNASLTLNSSFETTHLKSEIPFELLAISTIYSEIPEELLIGISLESDSLSIFTKNANEYFTISYDFNQIEWDQVTSTEHAIQQLQFSSPSINQDVIERVKNPNHISAIIGDQNSIIAQIAQNISNHKDCISEFTLTIENLNALINTFTWQTLHYSSVEQTTFINALRMKILMENYGISEVHYRSTEKEFPTSDSFFDWPDTIASLYFFQGGGFTVSPVINQNPTKGYVVALEGYSQIVSASDFFAGPYGKEAGRQMIKEYLKQHARQFLIPHIYFGVWHDTERDLIFLDLSEVVQDLDEAIQLAKERDQIAIYDLTTGTVIETYGSGGISSDILSCSIFSIKNITPYFW
jgi:hypothetical protein